MLPALILVSIAISAWAWWLVGKRRPPRWVRWSAPVVAATAISIGLYSMWRLQQAFATAGSANPAERQHLLASELTRAYTVLAVGWAIGVVAIVMLTWVTLRRSVRAPTSANQPMNRSDVRE